MNGFNEERKVASEYTSRKTEVNETEDLQINWNRTNDQEVKKCDKWTVIRNQYSTICTGSLGFQLGRHHITACHWFSYYPQLEPF